MNKTCAHCGSVYEVSDADLQFLQSVSPKIGDNVFSIPAPTLCPACRMQRRLTWRNERTLYKRRCDFSGKQMMSMYAPDSPFKVYDYKEWYSDKWDPLEFGRAYDFNRPFFDQFAELLAEVPAPSLNFQAESENCEYTNFTTFNKNCYLIFAASDDEDCYYCTYAYRNRKVVDGFFVFDSDSCYECIDCYGCNKLLYSQNCQNCSSSLLLSDCKSCTDSIGCVGLVQKTHHLFNKPSTRQEIEAMSRQMRTDPATFAAALKRFRDLQLAEPHKYYAGIQNESVTGDHISYSRDAQDCFDCLNLEHCKFCTWMHKAKDCYDCYAWGMTGELGYENHLCGNNFYNVRFCDSCWGDVTNLLYCRYCVNGTKNCFGCSGLKHKQYCILNKQYTKHEYEALIPKIIDHMAKDDSFGQFLPSAMSPFGYNETVAQEYFPMDLASATERGWKWRAELPSTSGRETVQWDQIAWPIENVKDAVTQEILACTACSRNFRIIPQELAFYREMGIALPRQCFDCRYRARRDLRNPRRLWDRACGKCSQAIRTSFAPERPEIIYCDACYLEAVY